MVMGNYKPPDFTAKFVERVRVARDTAGYTHPDDMAKALGVPVTTYRKYESRSCMPHHLIPKFCALTGVGYQQLFGAPTKIDQGNAHDHAA